MEEILTTTSTGSSPAISQLGLLFKGLPDLERGLVRVHLGKASPVELGQCLEAFTKISHVFDEVIEEDLSLVQSRILKEIMTSRSSVKDLVDSFVAQIDLSAAKKGDLADMFIDETRFPDVQVSLHSLLFPNFLLTSR